MKIKPLQAFLFVIVLIIFGYFISGMFKSDETLLKERVMTMTEKISDSRTDNVSLGMLANSLNNMMVDQVLITLPDLTAKAEQYGYSGGLYFEAKSENYNKMEVARAAAYSRMQFSSLNISAKFNSVTINNERAEVYCIISATGKLKKANKNFNEKGTVSFGFLRVDDRWFFKNVTLISVD